MAKVLVLYTSPIVADKSISTTLLNEFINLYAQKNPQDEITKIDLNKQDDIKQIISSENMATYFSDGVSDKYIELLKTHDKVILNAPMLNFNVPAVLKAFFDRVCVANKTFSYKYAKKGSSIGLLNHLDIQIIATQGAPLGWYPFSSHVNYLEGVWNFLGAKKINTMLVDGVKVEPLSLKTADEILAEYEEELLNQVNKF
ncbi:FMN-dependent NADH-azoreductase [Mycoplasma struthionis]|uniref:FMN dependent NADH:quinone oxidoreductase n=1 Tax=Mycoplasma struthionis TaxID=538220 RepID=A0A502M1X1_9MOLU|nr:FMN-dependent NADH-azoreductase [Mycoplasma struthionis]TPI01172.1 FMN-dependent NADH-azoreductase [Mycoplasma struthionis]